MTDPPTAEEMRLAQARDGAERWRRWGPYLSDRQWGTVREDYSADGTAWDYFPHDHARSRAYRWGEDGIAGLCDDRGTLCLSLALWNGHDPILKERLFGLSGPEGNHGEDVKEYAFALDNVPSHAYMKYLYKYPQRAFPYADLVATNRRRGRLEPEYELLDTGAFADDRYFDVVVEYAKAQPEDILVRISATNRGPETAVLHLLPTLLFRNTWSWSRDAPKPELRARPGGDDTAIEAVHADLGTRLLLCDDHPTLLFTENETNFARLFGVPNASPFVKDGIGEYVIRGTADAIDPRQRGTKAAAHYTRTIAPGHTSSVRLRLSPQLPDEPFGVPFDMLVRKRHAEADAFYARIAPFALSADMRNVQRQAFAGLLWNKQYYEFDVARWLDGDPAGPPPPPQRRGGRNAAWRHLRASDVLSMPDTWEFPWFAAWDLAFHTIPLALIDPDFAKRQLLTITSERYMSGTAAIPAYEWGFGDVNPPVHAWAAMRVYQIERKTYGRIDRVFLETMFHALVMNFTWWVNVKDAAGDGIFEGGFLGLDNIGPFDRSAAVPDGMLEEADATSWVAMYCLNLLTIALELAIDDPAYEAIATKFFEQFVRIADALDDIGGQTGGLWNDDAGFYYDALKMSDGRVVRIAADTIAGLVPLFATATNEPELTARFVAFRARLSAFVRDHPDLLCNIADTERLGIDGRVLLALVDPEKLHRILAKVLDPNGFLSPYGIRSVSRRHAAQPLRLALDGREYQLDYEPAESTSGLFGGNSNWRGPVWFPLNYLLIEALQRFHYYLGDAFRIEFPTGSGATATLWEVALELTRRLIAIFLTDERGRRPVYGDIERFATDPHWHDLISFHEYFHGDSGVGLGAANQTGWTALVAKLIQQYGEYAADGIERDRADHL